MPTQACTLLLASGVTLDLITTSIKISWNKEIQPSREDDNVIKIADYNRCQRIWTISCTLTKADKDLLEPYIRSKTTTDYPKLRIYDTAVPPYYTEYKVYFDNPGGDLFGDKFRITFVLPERTAVVS